MKRITIDFRDYHAQTTAWSNPKRAYLLINNYTRLT